MLKNKKWTLLLMSISILLTTEHFNMSVLFSSLITNLQKKEIWRSLLGLLRKVFQS